MVHGHIEHVEILHMRGIGILHSTMVHRVGGVHIAVALAGRIHHVGPCEIKFQARHHGVHIIIVGKIQFPQFAQVAFN